MKSYQQNNYLSFQGPCDAPILIFLLHFDALCTWGINNVIEVESTLLILHVEGEMYFHCLAHGYGCSNSPQQRHWLEIKFSFKPIIAYKWTKVIFLLLSCPGNKAGGSPNHLLKKHFAYHRHCRYLDMLKCNFATHVFNCIVIQSPKYIKDHSPPYPPSSTFPFWPRFQLLSSTRKFKAGSNLFFNHQGLGNHLFCVLTHPFSDCATSLRYLQAKSTKTPLIAKLPLRSTWSPFVQRGHTGKNRWQNPR